MSSVYRELERLRSYNDADQQALRQHFQLSQDLTLFRLTILAAIFLPLSFTTSLFGMNMKNQEEGLEFLSGVTNGTLDSITDADFRNSAQAIVSMIASSGNYNHGWPVFAGDSCRPCLHPPAHPRSGKCNASHGGISHLEYHFFHCYRPPSAMFRNILKYTLLWDS